MNSNTSPPSTEGREGDGGFDNSDNFVIFVFENRFLLKILDKNVPCISLKCCHAEHLNIGNLGNEQDIKLT